MSLLTCAKKSKCNHKNSNACKLIYKWGREHWIGAGSGDPLIIIVMSFFRRIFTCPSNPEVNTVSDESDTDPREPEPLPGKSRFRAKKNRRFRSANNIAGNRGISAARNRLSASENHLAGSGMFQIRQKLLVWTSNQACFVIIRLWFLADISFLRKCTFLYNFRFKERFFKPKVL